MCRHDAPFKEHSIQVASMQYFCDMYLLYLNPFQGDTGPPGPPGRRGKAGRRGHTGSPGDAKVGILRKDDKCNEENTGLLRFNSTSSMKKLLFCDGENWKVSEEFVCV